MNSENKHDDGFFKKCAVCDTAWKTRQDMLNDKDVYLIGYQAHFEDLKLGLLMFNHKCGGTFAIVAGEFEDMYNGQVFEKRLTGTNECPGYCRKKDNLEPCPLECECAYIREVVQLLKDKNA